MITNRIGTRNRGNIKRYEIVRSESNRGTVANLYEALLHFTGDYYITMGADDELFAETTLSDYMHVFKEQYYEPYLVVGNMAMYDGYMEKFQRAYLDKAAYDLMKTRDVEKIFGWLSHTCLSRPWLPAAAADFWRRWGCPTETFVFRGLDDVFPYGGTRHYARSLLRNLPPNTRRGIITGTREAKPILQDVSKGQGENVGQVCQGPI